MFRKLIIILPIFALAACGGPKESDYKSEVPVTRLTLEQRIAAAQSSLEAARPEESLPALPEALPARINLDIPFYSQAPEGNWDLPWQEACEEASLLLAHAYATSKELSLDDFKSEILAMVEWQNQTFGDYEHSTVEQTARILKEFLAYPNFRILEKPSIEALKKELAQGHALVAPFAGQELGNPFYSGEGPRYHMMVIRGYDEEHFIANDVGTRRGENFIYPYATLMGALHDWHETDMDKGEAKVIVVE